MGKNDLGVLRTEERQASLWRCPDCQRLYAYRRTCQNHMVAKHGYLWWDNNEVCVRQDLNNPTGPTRPIEVKPKDKL